MPPTSLQLLAPSEEYRADTADFLGKVFSAVGYYRVLKNYENTVCTSYDERSSRIGLKDGQIVTHCGVSRYTMRVGSARLCVAGIGGVGTRPDCRGRGYMSETMRGVLEGVRDRGYDMSLLFGVEGMYGRYGYVRAWNETCCHVAYPDLPENAQVSNLRRFVPAWRADLAALYNRFHRAATGSAVRSTQERGWFHPQPDAAGYLWTGRSRSPAGYVIAKVEGDVLNILDFTGDPLEILGAARRVARMRSCRNLCFSCVSEADPLTKLLRRGTCRLDVRCRRCGGAMVRTINLAACLQKMAGELSRRLAASPMCDWRGSLLVADACDSVCLHIRNGSVRPGGAQSVKHALRGGPAIAQLLIGTDNPDEVIDAARIRTSGDAASLTKALFPRQDPLLSPLDRF